ncbi:MAG: alpha-ketoglutarate-dependent dioxygenase AlkB [Nitrospira sp.]
MATVKTSPPEGFAYLPDLLSTEEERILLRHIEGLTFHDVRMHGVVAKRRVVHYGLLYGYETWQLTKAPPIPEWLFRLRDCAAGLMGVSETAIEEALINHYPEGAGIGWHRDAPMFGPIVVGFSLLESCRLRFQRTAGERRLLAEQVLEARSAYRLAGACRASWQHSIPPTKKRRYSITFRTLRTS